MAILAKSHRLTMTWRRCLTAILVGQMTVYSGPGAFAESASQNGASPTASPRQQGVVETAGDQEGEVVQYEDVIGPEDLEAQRLQKELLTIYRGAFFLVHRKTFSQTPGASKLPVETNPETLFDNFKNLKDQLQQYMNEQAFMFRGLLQPSDSEPLPPEPSIPGILLSLYFQTMKFLVAAKLAEEGSTPKSSWYEEHAIRIRFNHIVDLTFQSEVNQVALEFHNSKLPFTVYFVPQKDSTPILDFRFKTGALRDIYESHYIANPTHQNALKLSQFISANLLYENYALSYTYTGQPINELPAVPASVAKKFPSLKIKKQEVLENLERSYRLHIAERIKDHFLTTESGDKESLLDILDKAEPLANRLLAKMLIIVRESNFDITRENNPELNAFHSELRNLERSYSGFILENLIPIWKFEHPNSDGWMAYHLAEVISYAKSMSLLGHLLTSQKLNTNEKELIYNRIDIQRKLWLKEFWSNNANTLNQFIQEAKIPTREEFSAALKQEHIDFLVETANELNQYASKTTTDINFRALSSTLFTRLLKEHDPDERLLIIKNELDQASEWGDAKVVYIHLLKNIFMEADGATVEKLVDLGLSEPPAPKREDNEEQSEPSTSASLEVDRSESKSLSYDDLTQFVLSTNWSTDEIKNLQSSKNSMTQSIAKEMVRNHKNFVLQLLDLGKVYGFFEPRAHMTMDGNSTGVEAVTLSDFELTIEERSLYSQLQKNEVYSEVPLLALSLNNIDENEDQRSDKVPLWQKLEESKASRDQQKLHVEQHNDKVMRSSEASLLWLASEEADAENNRGHLARIAATSMLLAQSLRTHPSLATVFDDIMTDSASKTDGRKIYDAFIGTYVHAGFGALIAYQFTAFLLKLLPNPAVGSAMTLFEKGLKGLGPYIQGFMASAMIAFVGDLGVRSFDASDESHYAQTVRKYMGASALGHSFFDLEEALAAQERASEKWGELWLEVGMLVSFFAVLGVTMRWMVPKMAVYRLERVEKKISPALERLGYQEGSTINPSALFPDEILAMRDASWVSVDQQYASGAISREARDFLKLDIMRAAETLIEHGSREAKFWDKRAKKLAHLFGSLELNAARTSWSKIPEAMNKMKAKFDAGHISEQEWRYILRNYSELMSRLRPIEARIRGGHNGTSPPNPIAAAIIGRAWGGDPVVTMSQFRSGQFTTTNFNDFIDAQLMENVPTHLRGKRKLTEVQLIRKKVPASNLSNGNHANDELVEIISFRRIKKYDISAEQWDSIWANDTNFDQLLTGMTSTEKSLERLKRFYNRLFSKSRGNQ